MNYYLKPNVQIEPLVNQWHAYPFLIAPATAAMVTANYQMSIMESYLRMPMAHVAALKNPDMVGGPFIDLQGKRLEEVRALKKRIETRYPHLITFAESTRKLYELLRLKAKGEPMEQLYQEIPEELKGFVELVYDLEHHPSFRFIESLLYRSQYYDEASQSFALTLINSDVRPFIFSTPRLANAHSVHVPIAFSDERVDKLNRLKRESQPYEYIRDLLMVAEKDEPALRELLTPAAPRQGAAATDGDVRVRYFGHACVLIETKDTTILTDPLISYAYDTDIPRFTFEDLPERIDYVVMTHAHHDHVVIETLLQLRGSIRNVVVPRSGAGQLQDPSLKLILEHLGFKSVIEIDDLEEIRSGETRITGIPFYGEHCDLNIRSKSAYKISHGAHSFLMFADASSISPEVYRNVRRSTGPVDVMFVGLECTGAPMSWSYGALFPQPLNRGLDEVRRSNGSDYAKARQLVDIFDSKEVYLYAMGSEPWLNYFMALQHSHTSNSTDESGKLLEECTSRGIKAEKLFASKEIVYN